MMVICISSSINGDDDGVKGASPYPFRVSSTNCPVLKGNGRSGRSTKLLIVGDSSITFVSFALTGLYMFFALVTQNQIMQFNKHLIFINFLDTGFNAASATSAGDGIKSLGLPNILTKVTVAEPLTQRTQRVFAGSNPFKSGVLAGIQ